MNKTEILGKIKTLLTFSQTEGFLQASIGTHTIQVDGDSFEEGQSVFIVTEDDAIPASDEINGTYPVDGATITILDGVITAVEPESVEETVEEVVEEPVEEVIEVKEELKEEVEEQKEKVEEDTVLEEVIVETNEEKYPTKEELDALQEKVSTLETKLEALLATMGVYTEQLENFSSKVNTLWTDTPADNKHVDFKAESSKKVAISALDEIRAIRAKK